MEKIRPKKKLRQRRLRRRSLTGNMSTITKQSGPKQRKKSKMTSMFISTRVSQRNTKIL